MITGLDLNSTRDYILKDDKENPTIWKMGVIPSYLFAQVSMEAGKEGNEILSAYKMLQIGLKGWENFPHDFVTEETDICGHKINVVTMECLGKIPINYVNELAIECTKVNTISKDERKN